MATVLDGSEPEDDGEDTCPPETDCNEECPIDPPASSDDPVVYYTGTAVESCTDLTLPGPRGGWALKRSYNSGLLSPYGTNVARAMGYRWLGAPVGQGAPFVRLVRVASAPDILYFTLSAGRWIELVETGSESDVFVPRNDNFDQGISGATRTTEAPGHALSTEKYVIGYKGKKYIYYGWNEAVEEKNRGNLYKVEPLYNPNTDAPAVYTYNANRQVAGITPGYPLGANGYTIEFTYNGNYLASATIKKSGLPQQKVEYTHAPYGGNYAGHYGDLIQVKVSQRASNDTGSNLSIVKYTQYRYYKSGDADGDPHQLKMVIESDAIHRVLGAGFTDENSDPVVTPDDILGLPDADVSAGSIPLKDFASRSFTYYTTDLDTSNVGDPLCLTAWQPSAGENLHAKYGGSNFDESQATRTNDSYKLAGMVRSETVNGACASCSGGSSGGVKRNYYYLKLNGWLTEDLGFDEADRISGAAYAIVIDTVDSAGNGSSRKIVSVNDKGQAIRTATLTNPNSVSASNVWCESKIYGVGADVDVSNDIWQRTEHRFPSAHKDEVASNGDIAQFLNPYDPSTDSWANDTATVSSSAGRVDYCTGWTT